jgi:hypothetical protein
MRFELLNSHVEQARKLVERLRDNGFCVAVLLHQLIENTPPEQSSRMAACRQLIIEGYVRGTLAKLAIQCRHCRI